jgi:hypothetical protein
MSFLKINRDIALEAEELNRQNKFFTERFLPIILDITGSYGILAEVKINALLVSAGTATGSVRFIEGGQALDSDGLLITQIPKDNISIADDSLWYWLKISHEYSPLEEGTVSVNPAGEITGISTKFTEVLRPSTTGHPTSIKFYRDDGATPVNTSEYQIENIIDDTSIIVSGSLSTETTLRYSVIGSFTYGQSIAQNKKEPYQYDSTKIELIAEAIVDTAPTAGFVIDKQFYLARIQRSGATVTIQDKRSNYWSVALSNVYTKAETITNARTRVFDNTYTEATADAAGAKPGDFLLTT